MSKNPFSLKKKENDDFQTNKDTKKGGVSKVNEKKDRSYKYANPKHKYSNPSQTSGTSQRNPRLKVNLAAERLKKLRENLANRVNEQRGIESIKPEVSSAPNRKTESSPKILSERIEKYKRIKKSFNKTKYEGKSSTGYNFTTKSEEVKNATKTVDVINENVNRSNEFTSVNVKRDEAPSNVSEFSFMNSLLPLASNTSVDDSIQEPMEWEPTDEESLLANIKEIRQEVYLTTNTNNDFDKSDNGNSTTEKGTYVVVDSNVFISQLSVIRKLLETHIPGLGIPIVYLPWMVVQELDYMKNGSSSLTSSSKKAIKFINVQLERKNPHFKAETALEASKCKLTTKNPDDMILGCCLQLAEEGKSVILLTNDINLRNKALIHNLKASDVLNIFNILTTKDNQDVEVSKNAVMEISSCLTGLLNEIIDKEMKKAYGNTWKHMHGSFPYTLKEAINNLDIHWLPVYSEYLQKQCKTVIQNLSQLLKTSKLDDSEATVKKFTHYCLSLCVYLKNGFENYKDQITKCTNCIENVSKSIL